MQFPMTILIWAACLLGLSAASPTDDVTAARYTESLQMLFGKGPHGFVHQLWHGPQGTAVNVCNQRGFRLIRAFEYKGSQSPDLNNVPFPSENIKVPVPMEGSNDCYYINDGTGNAGRLQCGGELNFWLWRDLHPDPSNRQPVRICYPGGAAMAWKRAYYVEY